MLYQKEIAVSEEYDVVVCGGGFSGFAAAYSAAREGAKVILIERNTCLGGVGTQALVNHILGARKYDDADGLTTCVAGIFAELEEDLLKEEAAVDSFKINFANNPHGWYASLGAGMIFDNERMKILLEQKLLERGVKILYYTDIVDVVKKGTVMEGVIVHNKDGLQVIKGSYFVDATGDGDICTYAGCEAMVGDAESGMAAASLEMHVENVDYESLANYMAETDDRRFRRIIRKLTEDGVWKFPYEIFISVMLTRKDVFMINTIRQVGISGIDAASMTKGMMEGRQECYELLKVMREHFPGFKNAEIKQIAPVIGIRETRRIRSEYILTVEDLVGGRNFDDSIGMSAYGWDLPDPKRPSHQPSHNVVRKSEYTQIPYRCLLPVGVDNLIMAGRCIGVEREVLGVVRVMGPCLAMGECAGIASKLALQDNISYRDVNIAALKKRIHECGGITEREQVR